MNQILLGDCLEVLKTLPAASVDSIVTDPPYGLGAREPTGEEIIQYLQGGELDTAGDFMGRDWTIPPVSVWCECFRVLKPGGHLLSFGGTRTFDLISIGIRAAGFECRDTIAEQFGVMCLEWIQGQGFPKSSNIRKALEKAGLSAEEAEQFEGLGTALKPSWEPVLVFRKPIVESTVARQVLATGTGALNINACRVNGGRWPANLLLTHGPSCELVGTQKIKAPVINRFNDGMKPFGDGAGHEYTSEQTGDADGMEEVPVYECADGCPVKLLDQHSGERPVSGSAKKGVPTAAPSANGFLRNDASGKYVPIFTYANDSGGASRYFTQFELEAPFFYSPKVSKSERDRGLPKGTNKHPTVKPLALMRWLVRLTTPQGGVVADPYCGTGTTCLAALEEGCGFIGIERDPESHRVAVLRTTREPDIFDELETLR